MPERDTAENVTWKSLHCRIEISPPDGVEPGESLLLTASSRELLEMIRRSDPRLKGYAFRCVDLPPDPPISPVP